MCRLEIAKTILEFVIKFEPQLNLPLNLREVVKTKNLKYCQLKSECKSDIFDKQNEIVKNFFPKSDARICRRKKLDNFSISNETAKTNKNDKQKVLLLSGTTGDAKNEDKNDFVETLRRYGFDVRKVPVLKTTFTNQVRDHS